jgi:cyclomaltodextrinase
MSREPGWVEHAIWWQLYPLGFVDAYPVHAGQCEAVSEEHRLLRIVSWLDHAVELGASGIALGPIFASSTHGYDTIDHYRIDPRLGDENDFDQLVDEAHRRGLRVLLDGVFNHVGREHPRYLEARESGEGGPSSSWFRLSSRDEHGAAVYETFEGHEGLIALDHRNPEVVDYVTEVMCHWLDRGADGWRLDAAYAVPAAFWAAVLPRVRAEHPDAWLVGEVIHGDYAAIIEDSSLDSLTQYELWKAIWSSITDHNWHELDWTLRRHDAILDSFVPATFIGNHDVTRIATRIPDDRHLAHALVVLMTVGGIPSIYAGDEYRYRGTKEDRAGGDDAIRPPFPEHGPNQGDADALATMRLHQDLIGLRRRHPWLHRARTRTLLLTSEHYVYESRDGASAIVVALNLGERALTLDPQSLALEGQTIIVGEHAAQSGSAVVVGAHGWAITE